MLAALLVVIVDQATKFCAAGKHAVIAENFFSINYIKNTGIGFGLFQGNNSAIIFLTLIFIGLVLYYYDRIPKNRWVVLLAALVLGGAVGNLIDRIALGFVRDFIDFAFWPAFNIADSAITIGAVGLIAYFIKKGE